MIYHSKIFFDWSTVISIRYFLSLYKGKNWKSLICKKIYYQFLEDYTFLFIKNYTPQEL